MLLHTVAVTALFASAPIHGKDTADAEKVISAENKGSKGLSVKLAEGQDVNLHISLAARNSVCLKLAIEVHSTSFFRNSLQT